MRRLVFLRVKASPASLASAVLCPIPIRMSDTSDYAELDSRDDDALVFARVGHAKLCPDEEDQDRDNHVPLTSAADNGVICVRDSKGTDCTNLHIEPHAADLHTRRCKQKP